MEKQWGGSDEISEDAIGCDPFGQEFWIIGDGGSVLAKETI